MPSRTSPPISEPALARSATACIDVGQASQRGVMDVGEGVCHGVYFLESGDNR